MSTSLIQGNIQRALKPLTENQGLSKKFSLITTPKAQAGLGVSMIAAGAAISLTGVGLIVGIALSVLGAMVSAHAAYRAAQKGKLLINTKDFTPMKVETNLNDELLINTKDFTYLEVKTSLNDQAEKQLKTKKTERFKEPLVDVDSSNEVKRSCPSLAKVIKGLFVITLLILSGRAVDFQKMYNGRNVTPSDSTVVSSTKVNRLFPSGGRPLPEKAVKANLARARYLAEKGTVNCETDTETCRQIKQASAEGKRRPWKNK
ncbi:MAG: hypothetical protein COT85_01765 [Chlamydiae bacterium CG10_big_fil_rev_8_21_14_0_10_42_34]|nr:MAG: hypothetical protein COT85_01765 [Chlamydiae bacterium CG10_big_fil_rev_8_21_14_0_10_42_34]